MIIKICGLKETNAAAKAIEDGADLLGMIMVPGRKRTVSLEVASDIAQKARAKREESNRTLMSAKDILRCLQLATYKDHNEYFEKAAQLISENGPFSVGVFRNQDISQVFQLASDCSVDFIQLHGNEKVEEYLDKNSNQRFGIIKRYVIPDHTAEMNEFFPSITKRAQNTFVLPLLDSEAGGEGKVIDWTLIDQQNGKFLLAGGLNPENLQDTREYLGNVIGLDVSGGVEKEDGTKDLEKIEKFVTRGKALS